VRAQPVLFQGTGHYYEYVVVPAKITWTAARTQAAARSYSGCPGHLATITSAEENAFLSSLPGLAYDVWVGGFQPDGSLEPGGNWQWVTGEPWSYTAWCNICPNNQGGAENSLTLQGFQARWNDVTGSYPLEGYLVEYDMGAAIALSLHRISAPDGAFNSASPGTAKGTFLPGETVRVTLRADNTGAEVPVVAVLNIIGPDHTTTVYDSHQPAMTSSGQVEDNPGAGPLKPGAGYSYYSFDWAIPTNALPGSCDLLGAIYDSSALKVLYDTTAPGRNTGWGPAAYLTSKFTVSILPRVSNVVAAQRPGTKMVDVTYDLAGGSRPMTVLLGVSTNGGARYDVPAVYCRGDGYGNGRTAGTGKRIEWDAGLDWNGRFTDQLKVKVTATDPTLGAGFAESSPLTLDTRIQGAISGSIAFRDLQTNLLTRTEEIGTNLLVRVWRQNTAWSGTQTTNSPFLVAETAIPNLGHAAVVSFTNLTDPRLLSYTTYDLGVSATPYNDWKVIPVTLPAEGRTNADVTVTFHDIRRSFFGTQARTDRYHFVDIGGEAKAAVEYAMSVWERTGLVVFEPAEPAPTADLNFAWGGPFNDGIGEWRWWDATVAFDKSYTGWMPWTNREVVFTGNVDQWAAPKNFLLSGTAMHEIGHALGLRFNCYWLFECKESRKDSAGQQFSVMSYLGQPAWLGYSDVKSLHKRVTGSWVTVSATLGAGLVLTLPDGRVVSEAANTVAGASYVLADIDGDGIADPVITLTQPVSGDYTVGIAPKPGVDPAQPVTLTVQDGARRTVLLDAVAVSALPADPLPVRVDRDPPQLRVQATPGVVTGADGRMVPIAVSVQASDADTNIAVALLAITSSDRADTNAVQGAEIETDDRSFQIQAAVAGAKRVYTILYAASDASGNVAQATTDVVVIAPAGGLLLEPAGYAPADGMALRIFGDPGRSAAIQAAADLVAWTDIGRVDLPEGRASFTEGPSPNTGARFYRAVAK
jgi:hypothetical protein